jgi:hypothetical protein
VRHCSRRGGVSGSYLDGLLSVISSILRGLLRLGKWAFDTLSAHECANEPPDIRLSEALPPVISSERQFPQTIESVQLPMQLNKHLTKGNRVHLQFNDPFSQQSVGRSRILRELDKQAACPSERS